MPDVYQAAKEAAETLNVAAPPDGVVLYSVSFLPTTENRDKAFAFARANPEHMTIEQTECGRALVELGLYEPPYALPEDKVSEIWGIASERFIGGAKGNVTAFVDQADPRGVFRRFELPALLKNPNVTTINGIEKRLFAQNFA